MSREASRPRPSVLLLFDPLANDNDDHELNFDSFLQPPRNPSPVRLTRRLVDVGDVTVQFDNSELLLEDEDECDEKPEEIERTPKAQQRQSTRPTEGTPRAIPSIHATLSTPPSTALQVSEDDPQVLASFATPSAFLATPCESLITDTVLALPTPSPAAPGTTLVPPKQLDQHGSFALHDHNDLDEDTSFDLLNDKIPFLGHADEDSFELDGPPATIKSPIEVEEEEEPERVLPAAHPSVSSTITTNVIPELATPHCSPIPTFSAPPPLIPALKIVKRQRPEPKAPAATNPPKPPRDPSPVAAVFTRPPVFSAPPKVPPPIAPPAAVVPLVTPPAEGKFVLDGPGPRRVPNPNANKPKTAVLPNSGPRRVPAPKAVSPTPVEEPAVVKRPLRTVVTNTTTTTSSALPRPAANNGSRLPMPRSKIAVPARRKAL